MPHQHGSRAWLLFCSFCLDEGCGGVTADLNIQEDRVIWSNFGWDVGYEIDDKELARIQDAPVFTFDRARYEVVLLKARYRFVRPTRETP